MIFEPRRASGSDARGLFISKVTRNMRGTRAHTNFDAPASLRKWPSRGGQRITDTEYPGPYMLMEDTLGRCLRELMAKSASQRHLYEIHTSPQEPLIAAVISAEHAAELVRGLYIQILFK